MAMNKRRKAMRAYNTLAILKQFDLAQHLARFRDFVA